MSVRLLLVGYGKMGRMVEELAPAHGCEVAGIVDVGRAEWDAAAEVAIDMESMPSPLLVPTAALSSVAIQPNGFRAVDLPVIRVSPRR